jgi:SAM-dependent methyltransferase
MLSAYGLHCGGGSPTRFLEVACGPARHSILLAEKVADMACFGLDRSADMLEYAWKKARAAGVGERLQLLQLDMESEAGYEIPGGPVDAAALMLGSLAHCLDNSAAVRCFQNVSR